MPYWIVGGLVLYFDGSLRTPRDFGFPTSSLGRMGSCGAAVFSDDNTVLALGGKSIELYPDITSADVEYDALLFGLDWLNRQDCLDEKLVIRGDCKSIIDQLNGRSMPRKSHSKHVLAMEHHDRIRQCATISYEHVARGENAVCDSICAGVMNIIENRQVSKLREEMALLQESTVQAAPYSALVDLMKRFVSNDKSLVRYSLRPDLYKEAISIAESFNDAIALQYIGQQLVLEAKVWPNSNHMNAEGIFLQVRGYKILGRDKEADRLLRKHRHSLHRFSDREDLKDATLARTVLDSDSDCIDRGLQSIVDGEAAPMLQGWYDQAYAHRSQLLQGYWLTDSKQDVPCSNH